MGERRKRPPRCGSIERDRRAKLIDEILHALGTDPTPQGVVPQRLASDEVRAHLAQKDPDAHVVSPTFVPLGNVLQEYAEHLRQRLDRRRLRLLTVDDLRRMEGARIPNIPKI